MQGLGKSGKTFARRYLGHLNYQTPHREVESFPSPARPRVYSSFRSTEGSPMRTLIPRPARRLSAVLALAAAGCIHRLPDANPAEIPALRAQLEARPEDLGVRTRLGIALYKGGQHQDAIATLTPVVEKGDANGGAYLYLGLANEELQSWAAAKDAYTKFVASARNDPVKDQIRGRLELIARRELQEQAKAALAQEAQLSQQPPTVRSVAVFPFRLTTPNEELEPLQVALADMMITDLGLSNGLTVLERTQVQSLLQEMALSDAGYTDQSQGARAGHMLRAEHVVQGALTTVGDQQIRFDADVLNTQRGSSAGNMTQEQQLNGLFDLEKVVVFQVLGILGVELTPAEREAINQNRAENLLAFLAYGRGLQAMDRGDFAAAAQFFNQAVQLDPGFSAARAQAQEVALVQTAANTTPTEVAQTASTASVLAPPATPAVTPASPASTTLTNIDMGVNPTPTAQTIDIGSTTTTSSTPATQNQNRDPVQESSGSDAVTKSSTAKIVIQVRRPGTN